LALHYTNLGGFQQESGRITNIMAAVNDSQATSQVLGLKEHFIMHVNIIDILTYVCVFKDFTLQKFQ
jgi:hypothetical protein